MSRLGLLVCLAILFGCTRTRDAPPSSPVIEVKAVRAALEDIPQVVTAPASVYASRQANVAPRIVAPIRELRVKKGDTVRAGQILAILENRDLVAQRQEAEAAVNDAEANFQKTVGGTLPTDVERAKGELRSAQAALIQAQKDYNRRRGLFEQGAIPERDLLQSQTALATAEANYDVARKSLDLLESQSRGRDIAIARARFEEARARLAAASANLQYTEIRSPFAGTITEQFQYPGDMGGPGTPIFTISDLSMISARAQVPEGSTAAIRIGQVCTFEPTDNYIGTARGRVTVVNRAVDPLRRTIEVWCEVPKPTASLRTGVFGTVSVQTNVVSGAVVVPMAAVQLNEGTQSGISFVVDEKKIARKREVLVGPEYRGKIQVRSGIHAGEFVIVEGGYALPDGSQVRLSAGQTEGGAQ